MCSTSTPYRPAVILGDFSGRRVPRLEALGWGRMKIDRALVDRAGNVTVGRGEPWAGDNGAFRMWTSGGVYDWTRFEELLLELAPVITRDPCYLPRFFVAPDRPAEGLGSMLASLEWMHEFHRREERFPVWVRAAVPFYLAVQDGMSPADLELECDECGERVVDHFAGIFLGGSSEWKVETASAWAEAARDWWHVGFHYARAGTIEKLRQAYDLGADSVDSAFPMWTSERWSAFEAAWLSLPSDPQRELPMALDPIQHRLAL